MRTLIVVIAVSGWFGCYASPQAANGTATSGPSASTESGIYRRARKLFEGQREQLLEPSGKLGRSLGFAVHIGRRGNVWCIVRDELRQRLPGDQLDEGLDDGIQRGCHINGGIKLQRQLPGLFFRDSNDHGQFLVAAHLRVWVRVLRRPCL